MTTLLIDSFLVVVLLFLTSNASFVFCSVFTACFKTSTCALNYINKEQVDNWTNLYTIVIDNNM